MRATATRNLKTKATAPLTEDQRRLAADHAGLVERVAETTRTSLGLDERLSAGAEGLVNAAATYDPGTGKTFRSWALLRIHNAIIDAGREGKGSLVKIGRRGSNNLSALQASNAARPYSLDFGYEGGEFANGRGTTLGAMLLVEREEPPVDREMVRLAVRSLGPRTGIILAMYFGCGWPMRMIAQRVGLTESRVSQITSDALAQLRDHPRIREAMAS